MAEVRKHKWKVKPSKGEFPGSHLKKHKSSRVDASYAAIHPSEPFQCIFIHSIIHLFIYYRIVHELQ